MRRGGERIDVTQADTKQEISRLKADKIRRRTRLHVSNHDASGFGGSSNPAAYPRCELLQREAKHGDIERSRTGSTDRSPVQLGQAWRDDHLLAATPDFD